MLVFDEYKGMTSTQTAIRKFPLQVSTEETKWKFKVVFADNFDEKHESEWLWKGKIMDKKNRETLDDFLDKTENELQFKLNRSIQNGLAGLNRERQIEAKIHRLMDRY